MTLSDAKVNTGYTIKEITGEGGARRRLLDMGFTPGSKIHVNLKAPGGGTILINIRGFIAALRDDACQMIELKEQS